MRRPLARRREADQTLDQPQQQRQIELEPLSLGHGAQPLHIAMQARAVDLGQRGESGGDLGIKLDALAGDELECAAHAALAQRKRRLERLGVDLLPVALERGANCLFQILFA